MNYGIRIKALKDGNETDYWFDSMQTRDYFIKRFSQEHFIIVEYLSEQMELPFDIR